jgi:hypothetical protein
MIDSPGVFFLKMFGALTLGQALAALAQWYFNRKVYYAQ